MRARGHDDARRSLSLVLKWPNQQNQIRLPASIRLKKNRLELVPYGGNRNLELHSRIRKRQTFADQGCKLRLSRGEAEGSCQQIDIRADPRLDLGERQKCPGAEKRRSRAGRHRYDPADQCRPVLVTHGKAMDRQPFDRLAALQPNENLGQVGFGLLVA